MGYEPVSRTVHRYDGGRLVETITTPGQEWDPFSYALAALYRQWKKTLCPGCGNPYSDHVGETWEDYVGAFQECPAVEAMDRRQAEFAKADEKAIKDKQVPEGTHPARSRFWYPMARAVADAINRARHNS